MSDVSLRKRIEEKTPHIGVGQGCVGLPLAVEFAEAGITLGNDVLKAVSLSIDTLRSSDAVLILTDHPEFDYPQVVREATLIIDTRNATRGLQAPQGRIVRL